LGEKGFFQGRYNKQTKLRYMKKQEAEDIADEIIALYEKYGNADYIGEPVSQIEHMCQCAQFAERGNYDDEVILAAFFHDIGHLCEHIISVNHMSEYGVVDHEKIGASFLSDKGFSEKITRLIASHVDAKRYLTYKNPDYFDRLSEASKNTLNFQGGPMTPAEAEKFEQDELFHLFILLRGWDERGKEEHVPLPDLNNFRKLIIKHLAGSQN
jgi:2-amino-1-hydroxyethylphosphonate dioxygenase (glycine-forming)